ncbi:MAG: hypothetical protein R3A51_12275 [Nannocystaceae bacterium]
MIRARRWISGLSALCAGCLIGLPSATEVGEHIIYSADEGLVACAGTAPYLDGFVPYLLDELGVARSGDHRFRYYWIDQDELERRCVQDEIRGCLIGQAALASSPASAHELAHAVIDYTVDDDHPDWVFNEGIATAYDPSSFVRLDFDAHAVDPRTLLISKQLEFKGGYEGAGLFTWYLLHRFGPERYRRLFRRVDGHAEVDDVREDFAAALGVDFDEEVEAFLAGPACEPDGFSVRPYFCSFPEEPWEGDRWAITLDVDCDDSSVVGSAEQPWTVMTLRIPDAGWYRVRMIGGSEVAIGRCDGCPWGRATQRLSTQQAEGSLELDAGVHFLRVEGSGPVGVTISPDP